MEVFKDLPPDLPKHQPVPLHPVAATSLASWPLGTFIENMIVRTDGDIIVSVHSAARLEKISAGASPVPFAQFPAPPTSIIDSGDHLFVFGGIPGQSPGLLWRVEGTGNVEPWAEIPGSLFLNGSSPFHTGTVLVVDSLAGCIFHVDLETRQSTVWLRHELLTKITTFPLMPGGNGLKIFGGYAYISNTDRAILLRIPIQPNWQAGSPEIVAEHLRADDFAFDIDGNLYLATHIENTVERLAPSGERIAIAGPSEGMPGSTAVRFGPQGQLYVTTTGGLIAPFEGVAQQAKLISLDARVHGHPIEFLEAQ